MISIRPTLYFGGVISLIIVAACGGGGGGSTSSVSPPPPPPPPVVTATAGADQTVAEASVVELSGSGTDSGGGTVTYNWTQTSGPAVALSASDVPNPTFTAPDVTVADPRQFTFRLTVSNGQGQQDHDDVTITVRTTDFLLFTAIKDTPNTRELYLYDVLTDAAVRISGPMVVGGNIGEYKLSPDGAYAAYLADQDSDEQFELYVAATDGSGWQKVSGTMQPDGDVSSFDWAPDSAALVYIADADTDTVDDLYIVSPDSSGGTKINAALLAGDRVLTAHWSPDSRYIAYDNIRLVESSARGVNVYDTSFGTDTRITSNLGELFGIDQIQWSPDSGKLGYIALEVGVSTNPHLYAVAPDGSGSALVGTEASRYAWSPDGAFLAMTADPNQDMLVDLFAVRPDGSSLTQLNTPLSSGGRIEEFVWSPNSTRIAYTFRPGSGVPYRLFTVQPDGSSSVRVSYNSSSTSRVQGFGWAPDNSRIAFRENPDDGLAFEIFTALPDGTGSVRVSQLPTIPMRVTSLATGAQLWAPNSTKLAWRSEIDDTDLEGVYSANGDGTIDNLVSLAPAAGGGQLQSFGLWSPDSSVLAYTSQQDSPVTVELYIGAADSSMNMKVSGTLISNATVFDDFSWSP